MPYYGPVIDPWGGTKKGLDILADMPAQLEDRAWKNEQRGYVRQERDRQESLRSALQGAMQGETDLDKAQGIREAYGANAPEKMIEGDKIIESIMLKSPNQLDAARRVKDVEGLSKATEEVGIALIQNKGVLPPRQREMLIDKYYALSGGRYSRERIAEYIDGVNTDGVFTTRDIGNVGTLVIGPDGNWKVVQNRLGGIGKPDSIVVQTPQGMYSFDKRTKEVAPLQYGGKPLVGSTSSPELQGEIAGAKASGKEIGKSAGEAIVELKGREASLPRLETVVKELSDLGKKATYTYVGQGVDFARRQVGMDVGEGAIARKEYTSKVDNEILPLLRQTFGAQFTQKEGESLKATLGDPNASPEEKDAVLRSFIDTKKAQIEQVRRKIDQPIDIPAAPLSIEDRLKKYRR